VHELCLAIGLAKTRQILFFHAFTGCDVVWAFRGKGKKSAWLTWDAYTEVSDVFAKLSQYPLTVDDEDLQILESLWLLCMTDPAQPKVLTMPD